MRNPTHASIEELNDHPRFIPTVVGWIQAEWPSERSDGAVEQRLCGARERGKLPVALVAVLGSVPVGFVSLVHYEKGIEEGRPHWIDALYVLLEYRGRGLGHRLLEAAESKAATLGIDRLFALTEIPELYLKAGWEKMEGVPVDSPRDAVVTKGCGFRLP